MNILTETQTADYNRGQCVCETKEVSTDGGLGLNQLEIVNLNYSQGHNNSYCTLLLMNWRHLR